MFDSIKDSITLRDALMRVSDPVSVGIRKNRMSVAKLVPMCNALCTRAKMVMPELRSIAALEEMGNYAVAEHNTLIINELFLNFSASTVQGVMAHKLGHLVLNHKQSSPEVEREADKFAQFLLLPAEHNAWIKYQEDKLSEVMRNRKKQNPFGKLMRFGKSLLETKLTPMYGDLKARIAALREPLTTEEIQKFEDAIKAHNKKFEPSRYEGSVDIAEPPPHRTVQAVMDQKIWQAQQQKRQKEHGGYKGTSR